MPISGPSHQTKQHTLTARAPLLFNFSALHDTQRSGLYGHAPAQDLPEGSLPRTVGG